MAEEAAGWAGAGEAMAARVARADEAADAAAATAVAATYAWTVQPPALQPIQLSVNNGTRHGAYRHAEHRRAQLRLTEHSTKRNPKTCPERNAAASSGSQLDAMCTHSASHAHTYKQLSASAEAGASNSVQGRCCGGASDHCNDERCQDGCAPDRCHAL